MGIYSVWGIPYKNALALIKDLAKHGYHTVATVGMTLHQEVVMYRNKDDD